MKWFGPCTVLRSNASTRGYTVRSFGKDVAVSSTKIRRLFDIGDEVVVLLSPVDVVKSNEHDPQHIHGWEEQHGASEGVKVWRKAVVKEVHIDQDHYMKGEDV